MVLSFCIALKENIIIPENENTEITYKIENQLQPEYTNVSWRVVISNTNEISRAWSVKEQNILSKSWSGNIFFPVHNFHFWTSSVSNGWNISFLWEWPSFIRGPLYKRMNLLIFPSPSISDPCSCTQKEPRSSFLQGKLLGVKRGFYYYFLQSLLVYIYVLVGRGRKREQERQVERESDSISKCKCFQVVKLGEDRAKDRQGKTGAQAQVH